MPIEEGSCRGGEEGKLTKTASMLNGTEFSDVKIFSFATTRTGRFEAIVGSSSPCIPVHRAASLTLLARECSLLPPPPFVQPFRSSTPLSVVAMID